MILGLWSHYFFLHLLHSFFHLEFLQLLSTIIEILYVFQGPSQLVCAPWKMPCSSQHCGNDVCFHWTFLEFCFNFSFGIIILCLALWLFFGHDLRLRQIFKLLKWAKLHILHFKQHGLLFGDAQQKFADRMNKRIHWKKNI